MAAPRHFFRSHRGLAGLLAACLLVIATVPARAQTSLPQVGLSYDIQVSVNMEDRTFTGRERITWRNPGATPVDSVPLHLYLNAFANGASTWLSERRNGRSLRFADEALEDDAWGYNEPRSIRQTVSRTRLLQGEQTESVAASWAPIQPDDGNALDRSLIQVSLPEPVLPGGELILDIEFAGRLPEPVARTGCIENMCFFAQWFPKLGAFETRGTRRAAADGFAARQFHASTEFYANFADYTVTIDAPEGFTIGATGRETNRTAQGGRQVLTYVQRAVHDFAFVVGTLDEYTSTFRPDGRGPDVAIRYLPFQNRGFDLERARFAVHGALQVLNERVGPYPYDTLTVVYPPLHGIEIGGMEYPTLFTGIAVDPLFFDGPLKELRLFELVDIHEFGHQYFQHLLATNEQMEAFMDEGFNTYWELEILTELFGREASNGSLLGRPLDAVTSARSDEAYGTLREAIARRPSSLFYPGTSGIQIYNRPGVTLATAKNLFGPDVMDRVFQTYFARWSFNHPDIEDFLAIAREVGGADLAAFLREGFFTPRHPDFKVQSVRTTEFKPPIGRYERGTGAPIVVTADNRDSHKELVIDSRARETDGQVWAQITDPGWADLQASRPGRVFWQGFPAEAGAVTAKGTDATYHETTVRIQGPAWTHLPVDVLFRFEDGVAVREQWSGRAAWRSYRFLRAAKLEAVIIDPDDKILIDHDVKNNSRLTTPDQELVTDWTVWTTAVYQALLTILWGAS